MSTPALRSLLPVSSALPSRSARSLAAGAVLALVSLPVGVLAQSTLLTY